VVVYGNLLFNYLNRFLISRALPGPELQSYHLIHRGHWHWSLKGSRICGPCEILQCRYLGFFWIKTNCKML